MLFLTGFRIKGYMVRRNCGKCTLNRFNTEYLSCTGETNAARNARFPAQASKRIAGNLRGVGHPIIRGKGDAPEMRSGLEKLDPHFGLASRDGVYADNPARLLLAGFRVLKNDYLSHAYREFEIDQCAMSVDDERMSLFAGHLFVWARSDDCNRNAEKHALATTPIVHGRRHQVRRPQISVSAVMEGVKRKKVPKGCLINSKVGQKGFLRG